MHRNMKLVSVALLAVMMINGVAAAQKGLTRNIISTFYPPDPEQQQAIVENLEMTAEQRQQMRIVNERYQRQSAQLRQRYANAYQNVIRLMNSEAPDKARVNEVLKAFHHTHSQIVDAEVQYWMDLKTTLTPAQNLRLWKLFEASRIRRD